MQNAEMDRSSPPLRWMVLQAGALSLRTKPFERELSPHEQINVTESLTWVWWPLELWPFHRLTYTRGGAGTETTHKQIFSHCRQYLN